MNIFRQVSESLSRLKGPSPSRSFLNTQTFFRKLPRGILWGAISLVILAIGGYVYYRLAYLPAHTTTEPALQTAIVRQGDLVISVSGSATLIARQEVSLSFQTASEVTEVNVAVGDQVKKGDLLAKANDTDQQYKYAQAKRSLQDLTSPAAIATALESTATAETSLHDAIGHLQYILSPSVYYWENQVQTATLNLTATQAAAAAAPNDKAAQTALQVAEAALKHAKSHLIGAKADYDRYVKNNFTYMIEDTHTHMMKKYTAEPSDSEILAARAAAAEAQATLTEANTYYAALTGGDVPKDATGSDLTALEQAKLDLETAQSELDGTSIRASIAGTVMAVDISVGDTVSTGTTAITIADLSQPYIEAYLDESDWGNIKVEEEADVTFDILPDKTFKGKVTQVDPGLYDEQNSTVVRAYVELMDVDTASFDMPLGTTGSVEVIGAKAENAVLIPIEALHPIDNEQYAVFVMENGKPRLRMVQIGIQDLLYAEVKSGLQAGDVVTTGITVTK